MSEAVYTREGAVVVATPYAAGPWHPGMQHGGAPSALVAWAAEQVPTATPMRIARVTVELLRPVPVDRLAIETEVIRDGRKIQLVQVRLLHAGKEVTRAMVLRMRIADLPLPADAIRPAFDGSPDGIAADRAFGPVADAVNFGANFEVRRLRGGFNQLGPGQVWFRQHRALIADEPLTPVTRAMAVADFSNGIAPVLPFDAWTFLNADLTVSFSRMPEGDWLFSEAESWIGDDGAGLAMTRLADRQGWFGRAVQSLVIERR